MARLSALFIIPVILITCLYSCQATKKAGKSTKAERKLSLALNPPAQNDSDIFFSQADSSHVRFGADYYDALDHSFIRHHSGSDDRSYVETEARFVLHSSRQYLAHYKPPTKKEKGPGYTTVPVYYGTSRSLSEKDYFSAKPNFNNTFGVLNVNIPDVHKKGEMNRPFFSDFGGLIYNPRKYIEAGHNLVMTEEKFYEYLKEAIAQGGLGETFVFIHGYNNDFKAAAYKTAQLFFDLNYPGVPVMYSWPSKGEALPYSWDEQQSESETNAVLLAKFLVDVKNRTGAKQINIIAHSMGNRLLCKALEKAREICPGIRFNHVIMAAPDVYREDFKRTIADSVKARCTNLSIYTSSKDWALNMSRCFHSGIDRLGQSGKDIFIAPLITTIDISSVPCSDIIGHSCYSEANPVIADIARVLAGVNAGSPPRQMQKILPTGNKDVYYWVLSGFSN